MIAAQKDGGATRCSHGNIFPAPTGSRRRASGIAAPPAPCTGPGARPAERCSRGIWSLSVEEQYYLLWPLLMLALPLDLTGWPNLVVHLLMTACLGTIVLREDTLLAPVLRFAPIARIGVVSYGIYLLHHIARHIASVVVAPMGGPDANLGLFTLIFWGTSWILAEISFRGYERHFLALRHKRSGRLKPAPETEGQGAS